MQTRVAALARAIRQSGDRARQYFKPTPAETKQAENRNRNNTQPIRDGKRSIDMLRFVCRLIRLREERH